MSRILTPDLRVSDIALTAAKFVGLSLAASQASLLMSPSSDLWACQTLSQWLCRRCPRGRNTRLSDYLISDNRWDVLAHSDQICTCSLHHILLEIGISLSVSPSAHQHQQASIQSEET